MGHPVGMRRFTPPPPPTAVAPEWAITFADLMCLLLVFFIMLVTFSNMDLVKYRAMVGSLREGFQGQAQIDETSPKDSDPGTVNNAAAARASEEVERELAALAKASGPAGPLQLLSTSSGVRLRVEGRMFFPVGSAAFTTQARPLLLQLAPLLRKYPYRVWVEGHTDDQPIQNQVYPSNWELSAARAGSVVRDLIASGGVPANRLVAVGYADTRPVAPNTDEAGRSRNRRVEFLLSKSPVPAP
jgi:chemotaxis protein MotB